MATINVREQLHQQIDHLPDEVVEQIADFTLFVMTRRHLLDYADWDRDQWREFSLEQFFSEEYEVEYTLKDAREIYHP